MTPGSSDAGRRVLLNRLYREYDEDPAFAAVRAEAGGVLVPGDGSVNPRLLFVGEAPGAREAKLRKPFVGVSGKFLEEMLESVGISREEVFITNCVKYRPKNNRDPEPEERHAGYGYLRREHTLLGKPPMVMLGKHATKTVTDGYQLPEGLTVGEWFMMMDGTPVLPLFHPAYGIYQRANRPLMLRQFQAVLTPPENTNAAVR